MDGEGWMVGIWLGRGSGEGGEGRWWRGGAVN